eukprot:354861-Chlamydomonas_euryale.AAC.7
MAAVVDVKEQAIVHELRDDRGCMRTGQRHALCNSPPASRLAEREQKAQAAAQEQPPPKHRFISQEPSHIANQLDSTVAAFSNQDVQC